MNSINFLDRSEKYPGHAPIFNSFLEQACHPDNFKAAYPVHSM